MELADASDSLFSTVTSSAALDAAKQTAPFLEARHVYADLNSVSPALKQEIAASDRRHGARFRRSGGDVARRAARSSRAHAARRHAARRFADTMTPFGMRLEVLGGRSAGAAAVKMCRSIVVKGLEALLCECVLSASQYGADEHVFASLNESYPGIDWKRLADYIMGRVVVHGERRAREMEEVAETLRAVGVEPIMADATARRQDWSAQLDLRSRFGPDGPRTYRDVLDVIAKGAVKCEVD